MPAHTSPSVGCQISAGAADADPRRHQRDRAQGGYEAVQMRAVAERADVAVGTLYRYFPSKVHLLGSALGREFERTDDHYHSARVMSDVWLTNLVAWLARRASATDLIKRLDLAMRLLGADGKRPRV